MNASIFSLKHKNEINLKKKRSLYSCEHLLLKFVPFLFANSKIFIIHNNNVKFGKYQSMAFQDAMSLIVTFCHEGFSNIND